MILLSKSKLPVITICLIPWHLASTDEFRPRRLPPRSRRDDDDDDDPVEDKDGESMSMSMSYPPRRCSIPSRDGRLSIDDDDSSRRGRRRERGRGRGRRRRECESLRERWVDILKMERRDDDDDDDDDRRDAYSVVRPMNRRERRYRHEAEMLVDLLLGMDANDTGVSTCVVEAGIIGISGKNGDASHHRRSPPPPPPVVELLREISKSILVASSGMALAVLFLTVLSSDSTRAAISSITPHIFPSRESLLAIKSTTMDIALQVQAIVHSAPYVLRHANRVFVRFPRRRQVLPFLLRLLRRCIILEAWRHIWTIAYGLTRRVKRSMKMIFNANKLFLAYYAKLCPKWIRRGLKSTFQSLVQAHVSGAVADLVGSASFEGAIWSSSSMSSSTTTSDDDVGGGGGIEDAFDFPPATMDLSGEEGADVVVQRALSQYVDSAIADVAAESMIVEGVMDALIEEVGEMS